MQSDALKRLLLQYKRGQLTADQLVHRLQATTVESLGYATIDHHRELRQGFPEVIFCEGKTPAQVAGIARRILSHGSVLLATRANPAHYRAVKKVISRARYNPVARVITANRRRRPLQGYGTILIVTAGTSDIPVAEEALETVTAMGNRAETIYDVGVAGLHRILSNKLPSASVVIVVAGMEGALASVAACPVSSPTRAAVMTGRYPTNTGITDWIPGRQTSNSGSPNDNLLALPFNLNLSLDEITIAEMLKDNGYRTMISGKWHLGEDYTYGPENQGFDLNRGGFSKGSPTRNNRYNGYFSPY